MTTYVAMLRGINVGGHQKISMADLRALVAGLGHQDVETYIQSGNVVFRSPDAVAESVARRIEEQIARELGLTVSVVVRTAAELKRVTATNPFLQSGKDPASLYVIFLTVVPDRTRLAGLDVSRFAPDEFRVAGREIFAHYPKGYGRSKMTNGWFEKQLKLTGTARNWNTVSKLAAIAAAKGK